MQLKKIYLVVSALLLSGAVHAEQVLEEILVTATKRAQSTQDIPMSVEAVSGSDQYIPDQTIW